MAIYAVNRSYFWNSNPCLKAWPLLSLPAAAGIPQLGLVAEDVEKVNPGLIVRDKEGKPYSVRYEQVNAMLLNEFLKEHKKGEQQQAVISQLQSTVAKQEANAARQQKQIEALTAGLQKVSAQVEMSRPAPQTVANNQ